MKQIPILQITRTLHVVMEKEKLLVLGMERRWFPWFESNSNTKYRCFGLQWADIEQALRTTVLYANQSCFLHRQIPNSNG